MTDFFGSSLLLQITNSQSLHIVDLLIIFLSLLMIIAVGYFFSGKQETASTFFLASGKVPAWVIGMSLLATIVSNITFLGYPGAGFAGNWILLVQGLVVALTILSVIWVIVPLYRNVISISAYEYFERRFGYFARLYCSTAFVLAYLSKMGTILYLLGMSLSVMLGLDPLLVIWVLGILVVCLTLFGGFEAIIWLDALQGFLLIAAGVTVFLILTFSIDGGLATIFQVAEDNGRTGFGPYHFSFVELTFWVMAINGFFFAIQNFGTNQMVVQRFITARTGREAIRASLMGILLSVPLWVLFMFIGTALYTYYTIDPSGLPENVNPDSVFPIFIMNNLPVGVVGLVISGLIAAAFSSLDSELSSVSAVITQDFYSRLRKNVSDRAKLVFGKITVVVTGVLVLLVATSFTYVGGEGALGIVISLYAIFSGGIAGMFLLGLFSRTANKRGLHVGIAACVIFTAYGILTSTTVNGGLLFDLGSWNFTHHKYMMGVYSHMVLFLVGYIASKFFNDGVTDENLTIYGWFSKRKARKPALR